MASAIAEPLTREPWPIVPDSQPHTSRAPSPVADATQGKPIAGPRLTQAHAKARTEPEDEAAVDRGLVQRVQQGDKRAFDLLVQKYQHRVAALLRSYVRDPAEREDVAQEAFLKAYRGLANFRGDSAFYTWLYRITVNTARNYLDARDRRSGLNGLDPEDAERTEDGALLRDGETPEWHCSTGELANQIETALNEMPACIREALTLREMNGLSYKQIAATMNCPIGTVRSRIARGRAMVETTIGSTLDGETLAQGEP